MRFPPSLAFGSTLALAYCAQASTPATGSFPLPLSLQLGQFTILNQCDYTVYMMAVDGVEPGDPAPNPALITMKANTNYAMGMEQLADGLGTSIKVSRDPNSSNWSQGILQIEYSISGGRVWYDGSNVNCQGTDCPFYDRGVWIQAPGEQDGSACKDSICMPHGCDSGANWYIDPGDNNAVRNCPEDVGITVYLCFTTAGSKRQGIEKSDPETSITVKSARIHIARAIHEDSRY